MKGKKILLPIIAIFISTLLLIFLPTETEGALYDDTIRLHILPQSNSEEDQKLKLRLRDDLLLRYASFFYEAEGRGDAEARIEQKLPEIKDFLENKINEYGYDYRVSLSLCREWYDTREYEDITLPKGVYTSLKIIIGAGEGKNWWCVMYPPLCLDLATEGAPDDTGLDKYTEKEVSLIKKEKEYNVKFKLLELFSSAFS